eukprot:101981_1
MHPGDRITWTWHNRLSGDSISTFLNRQRDLDITNIHTHGLHISPYEDDVLVRILPGRQQTYTYSIAHDHYPGTHWLHAHHHGSVSFQVASGLFSALLIEYPDKEELGDASLISMKENLLIFHWVYGITTDICNCTETEQWQSYFYYPPQFDVGHCVTGRDCFRVFSYCYEYCSMPVRQRILSGFAYNIESEYADNFQIFLVNGQYQPVIEDMTVDTFRRLRFLNAVSQYYIHYQFPITSCAWFIIAIDGIYLTDNEVRNLNESPYFGEYLLPSGGRLDVIVRCSVAGTYDIVTTESTENDPSLLEHIGRVPGDVVLFAIRVNTDGADTVRSIPVSYPPRPAYLTDLRSANTTSCACNTYFDPSIDNGRIVTWSENECGYVFNMQGTPNINGVIFDLQPMTSLEYGKVYEFTLLPHMHPYHQHVNPFQVQRDVGLNGFCAKQGDWYDTLGGGKFTVIIFRTHPIDFTGAQIVHCHFLPHEDIGMMTLMNILQPHQICDEETGLVIGEPTLHPTTAPTAKPTKSPTKVPTKTPTQRPTFLPTKPPTFKPTDAPTVPRIVTTKSPSLAPTTKKQKQPKPPKPPKVNQVLRSKTTVIL